MHLTARERDLGRAAGTDEPRQRPRRPELADRQADLHERGVDLRVRRREPDVGGQRQRHPAARGGAVDGRDDRHRQPADRGHGAGGQLLELDELAHAELRQAVDLVEVEAGAERLVAGAGDDQRAQLFLVAQQQRQRGQVVEHLERLRVHPLRAVQRRDDDPRLGLGERDRREVHGGDVEHDASPHAAGVR